MYQVQSEIEHIINPKLGFHAPGMRRHREQRVGAAAVLRPRPPAGACSPGRPAPDGQPDIRSPQTPQRRAERAAPAAARRPACALRARLRRHAGSALLLHARPLRAVLRAGARLRRAPRPRAPSDRLPAGPAATISATSQNPTRRLQACTSSASTSRRTRRPGASRRAAWRRPPAQPFCPPVGG